MAKKLKKNVPVLRFPEFGGDWEILTIEEVASVSSGGTPSRTEPSFWDGDIPWVTTSEISQTEIFDTAEKITQKGLENSSAKLFEKNTILMAMYGQGKARGQVSILRIEATTNQACAAITLKDNYNSEFTYYFLSREYERLRLLSNDGSQKNLSAALIKQYEIPLPSIAEQEKIASFLGAVDTRLNQLRRKRKLLQTYKRGVMQKLFSQQLRFTQPDGSPFPDWEEKKLGSLGIFKSGIGFSESEQGGKNGIPFFKVSDMNLPSNKTIMQLANNYINESQLQRLRLNPIKKQAIIFAKVGAAIFLETKRKAINFLIDNNMMAFIPSVNIDYDFLFIVFQNTRLSKYAQAGALPSYNGSDLALIKVDIPSIQEQEKIACFLTTIDRKIEALTRKIEKTEKFKKGLLQKLFV